MLEEEEEYGTSSELEQELELIESSDSFALMSSDHEDSDQLKQLEAIFRMTTSLNMLTTDDLSELFSRLTDQKDKQLLLETALREHKTETSKYCDNHYTMPALYKRIQKQMASATPPDLQKEIKDCKREIQELKIAFYQLSTRVQALEEPITPGLQASFQGESSRPTPQPEIVPANRSIEQYLQQMLQSIIQQKRYVLISVFIQGKPVLQNIVALVDNGADLNCIREGVLPAHFRQPSTETLNSACGNALTIKGKVDELFVCNKMNGQMFVHTPMVVVKNLSNKVILGTPFLLNILPFSVTKEAIITTNLGEPYHFAFLSAPTSRDLLSITSELLNEKEQYLCSLKVDLTSKQIELALQNPTFLERKQSFLKELLRDVCSDVPNAFWNRKQHIVSLPYESEFSEQDIPTKARPCQMNSAYLAMCQKEINELLSKRLIKPSQSPWCCTAFYFNNAAEKERGKSRLVINYKPLNKVLQWIRYPIPNKRDLLNRLVKAEILSQFDLKSGYWQIQIRSEDRYKIAFVVPFGHYEWTVMPFGLKNAPSEFQHIMNDIFSPYSKFIISYIDDVLVFSHTINQHFKHLRIFKNLILKNGLVLSEPKMKLFQTEIRFLGHAIAQHTHIPFQRTIEFASKFLDEITDTKQLQRFLGALNYVADYYKNLAADTVLLYARLKKKAPPWTQAHSTAVQIIKAKVKHLPCLALADPQLSKIVETDPSDHGYGGILKQKTLEDKEVLVRYYSGFWNPTQKNYSTVKKEMLSIIKCISKFQDDLLNQHFLLRVDCQAWSSLQAPLCMNSSSGGGPPFPNRGKGPMPQQWQNNSGRYARKQQVTSSRASSSGNTIIGSSGHTKPPTFNKPLAFCTTEELQAVLDQRSQAATTATPTTYSQAVQEPLPWHRKTTRDFVQFLPDDLNSHQSPWFLAHQTFGGSHLFPQRVGKTLDYYRQILSVTDSVKVKPPVKTPTGEIVRTQVTIEHLLNSFDWPTSPNTPFAITATYSATYWDYIDTSAPAFVLFDRDITEMAAPLVTLVGGLKAFDHTVVVDGEVIQTLALYMEGDASHMTYCPSGESIFGGHAEKPTSFVDSSRSCEFLSRRLATSDRVFFLPCLDSPEREDEAAKPETLALQRASWLVNKPPLPRMFEDGPSSQRGGLLWHLGIPLSVQLRCVGDQGFLDAWSAKTNTLVTCQGELSISLMDMDRIFGLPIAGQFYDEISPMVADFKEVWSTDLPFSCRYLFLAYHHLCRSSGSNTVSSAAWVEFWFRTEDDAVSVNDPWAAWHARFGKDAPSFREFTATKRDVFRFLHVTPGREDDVHLAALLSVWLSRFVFRSIGDAIRPMVFKVASYMATGVRFALAGPALACLYKGLGHAGCWMAIDGSWPYLYTWLARLLSHTREDLEVSRRPGMISFGDPSLKRNFTEDQACDLFQRLPVPVWHRYVLATAKTSFLVDERKKPIARQHYESLLSVRSCFLTVRRSIHFFVEPYCPARFARQFGYCQDLPGDMGITANQREISSLSELVALWKTSIVRPCGRLDLPPSGERDPSRDPGTTPAYYTWWTTHMSSLFQQNRLESAPVVSAVEDSDEDYDSDRSHPRKRRPNGKRPVGASSASKKRAPLTILADDSGSASKKKKARKEVPPASFPPSPPTFLPPIPETKPPTSCPSENPPIEMVQILSSPEAPAAPQEEASIEGEPAEITPALTQSEGLPVQEVAPSPLVVQEEAVVEAEAPPPAVEEGAPTPAVEVLAIEAVVEVIQEEVPTTEGALEVIEVVPAVDPVVEPAAEEVPLVQNLATPPTSSSLTSLQTPSQEFLSYVEGLMVQAWRERIVPRMLSPGVVSDTSLLADAGFAISRLQEMGHDVTRLRVYTQHLQTLKEIECSDGEKARRTSKDEAESIARNTLAIVSSKLEEAKTTLGEVVEELSEAKAEEEDARERLELARELLQSAGTKVAYLTTQAEQIQESVRGLKTGVVEAEQLIAEVIATPTLSAAEEATLLSSRAAFCGVTTGDGEESLGAALFSAF
ncbi:hypothetical protein H6P81_010317 [Aristolochia fimbriata]|uniref:Reverse transcriptase domain-containing protein n=1 Tax=Aristolochia fimbriata TaxID=158543 RepID=A0AAV7ENF6_ARIFI|nr:hypothetical protein H6P81_010317 [Aristolochia fimbriata]